MPTEKDEDGNVVKHYVQDDTVKWKPCSNPNGRLVEKLMTDNASMGKIQDVWDILSKADRNEEPKWVT